MKKIPAFLLLVLLITMIFSLTSCSSEENGTLVDQLLNLVPEEGSKIVNTANELGETLNGWIDNFFKFEWATAAIKWVDDTLGITRSITAITEAVDSIANGGDFLIALGKIILAVPSLLVSAVIFVITTIISLIFDVFVEFITIILTILGIVLLAGLVLIFLI